MDVVRNVPKCPVPVWMSYLTEVYGSGIDVVPNLLKRPISVWKSVPAPTVPYLTELTEVPGTCMDVVPIVPKCPVPVLMPYRTYRRFRYPYWCRTELKEVSGNDIDVVPVPVPVPVPAPAPVETWVHVPVVYFFRAYTVFHGGSRLRSKYFELVALTTPWEVLCMLFKRYPWDYQPGKKKLKKKKRRVSLI